MEHTDLITQAFDLLDAGIIILSPGGEVLVWNTWLARTSGLSVQRVRGRCLWNLIPGLVSTRIDAAISQALSGGAPTRLPHTTTGSPFPLRALGQLDGPYVPQEIVVSPLRAGGEHFCLLEIRDASAYAARESLHQRHAEGLRALTFSDSLTGIANRRQFDMTLDREVRRAQRNGHQLALLLLDIDSFKTYNDHFGHPQGDDCLRNVAQAIDQMARRSGDLVARYGGEEFAVILPESTIDQALHFGEALRMKVRRMQLPHAPAAARDIVTVSIGLALYEPGSRGKLSELIEAADSALYRAKHAGRDRVCLADRTSSNAGA